MPNGEPLSGTVVVTYPGFDPHDPEVANILLDKGLEIRMEPKLTERGPDDVVEILGDAVAVIADADPFVESVFSRAPRLKVVARAGVGFDSVDLEAATRAGVMVTTTPGANHETVADHTMGMILGLTRNLCRHDASTRQGEWARGGDIGGTLFRSTVGLVGYGSIGRAVGRRLRGFGCRVLVHDPVRAEADEFELVSLDRLLRESDVVSLHLPLNEATRHILSGPELESMKSNAIVVNTSRGGLIDEAALAEALESGQIAGAALDVFEIEPLVPSPLTESEKVMLSPHIGGVGELANRSMCSKAAACVVGALSGEDRRFVINPDVLKTVEV